MTLGGVEEEEEDEEAGEDGEAELGDSFDFTGDEDVVGDYVDFDAESEGVDGCLSSTFRLSRSRRGKKFFWLADGSLVCRRGVGEDVLVFSMEGSVDCYNSRSEGEEEGEDTRFE